MADFSRLTCAGCGWIAPEVEKHPYPFRCAARRPGDDIDHVVVRALDPIVGRHTQVADPNPFVRYRRFLHSFHFAQSRGVPDGEYVDIVRGLDDAVAVIDGRGFRETPWRRCARLSDRLGFSPAGGVWVKDETGNVSGSHKARHLMGIMLYLEVLARLGLAPPLNSRAGPAGAPWPPTPGPWSLAIASCGNAALAAAIVARAAGWPLDVFVPLSAEASIVARLQHLGARITTCERRAGEAGDPSYLRFQEALSSGSLPFCVQGSDNGLTIEGGETLAWEMIDALEWTSINRLIVQVGGGALASSCVQAFREAYAFGRIDRLPCVQAVQTQGGHPLARAYRLVAERLAGQGGTDAGSIHQGMRFARTHRSQFMWPWETEPLSIARGILDDETYDWAAVVEGMLLTGGHPIVVGERELEAANRLAREATDVDVDHTGSAGLAGLQQLMEGAERPSPDERIAVISRASDGRRAEQGPTSPSGLRTAFGPPPRIAELIPFRHGVCPAVGAFRTGQSITCYLAQPWRC
jgi:threonine synthase